MAKPRTIRGMTTEQDMLNSHRDGAVPVPVASIARALGIQVAVADMAVPPGIHGGRLKSNHP